MQLDAEELDIITNGLEVSYNPNNKKDYEKHYKLTQKFKNYIKDNKEFNDFTIKRTF